MARAKLLIQSDIDLYLQRLLILQYQASDFLYHKPTKGDLREKFIKQLIKSELPEITLVNGILLHKKWQSPQIDCILLRPGARHLGNMYCYRAEESQLCMEIKSCAKSVELETLNKTAKTLKRGNKNIKVGMFAYTTAVTRKTIFKNFGFPFDRELSSYGEYNKQKDIYLDIDFIFVLEVGDVTGRSSYYITKD